MHNGISSTKGKASPTTQKFWPRVPAGDTIHEGSSGAAFASYGPRKLSADGSTVEFCSAEEAQVWGVYRWHAEAGSDGQWQWAADCADADCAKTLAKALVGRA